MPLCIRSGLFRDWISSSPPEEFFEPLKVLVFGGGELWIEIEDAGESEMDAFNQMIRDLRDQGPAPHWIR